jgi:hypothetical protein
MAKLVLFDIDGTLVLTGRAGIRAMNARLRAGHRTSGALDGIAVAGRTDWIILHDALHAIGRDLDEDLFGRLRDAYVGLLREEIMMPGEGVKAAMPGVRALLDALHARPDVFLALLTGNFERSAEIKLEHFGLWHTSAAGRLATMPPTGMRWCRSRSSGRGCGLEADRARVGVHRRRHAARRRVCRARRRAGRGGYRFVQRGGSAPERRGSVFQDLRHGGSARDNRRSRRRHP